MTFLKSLMKSITLLFLGSLVAGCVNLNKTYPEIRYYTVEASHPEAIQSSIVDTRLQVRRLVLAPRYEGRELVYRTSEVEYRSDFYHQWFISPRAMLTEQVTQWLKQSKIFEHVIDRASYIDPTHILEGTITSMYGDFRNPEQPQAVLELQALLLMEGTTVPVIHFQRDYRQTISVSDTSPHSLIEGLNKGLSRILTQLEEDLYLSLSY